jgi:N-hydroxyarylamine O-acetyltransferase
VNIDQYLQRLNYQGSREPTLATLQALHVAHMLAVPFENLDITLGREIVLDEEALWRKIVEKRRGGFCYELNGLFAWALRELGFRVTLLSAAVMGNGAFGPEFDHLTLQVHLEEDWLADVGFGNSFRYPLRLQPGIVQAQDWGSYRLVREDEYWILQTLEDTIWKPTYRFTLQPRTLPDFVDMCHYQQTSPESHFTQRRVCTIATSTGRITLSDQRLFITADREQKETALTSQEAYTTVLAEKFGVVL